MDRTTFDLCLEFEHWLPQSGDDPEDDCFNMQVTLADGKRYALNVWTYKFVRRTVQDCRDTGGSLDGSYMCPPDLFVERLDRILIERVVADLIALGRLREDWEVRDHTDCP